jgi:biotin carboxylase
VKRRSVVVVDPYSSGNLLAPALRAAGFSVVAVLSRPSPPEVLAASYQPSDFDEHLVCQSLTPDIVERLRAIDPVAVLPGAEIGVELSDTLAAALTPQLANDPALASARRHKGDMVAAVADRGLRTIPTLCTSDPAKVPGWLAATGLVGRDLVLKPPRSAGTDGVTLAPGGNGWREVFEGMLGTENRLGFRNDEVLVQEYVPGVEYVVDTVTVDGMHTVTDILRYRKVRSGSSMAVYESMEYLPYDRREHPALVAYTREVLTALGVRFGAAHTEVILDDRGPVLVETGIRLAGGGAPSIAELATGNNPVHRLVRYLKGERDLPMAYTLQQHVCVVFLLVRASGYVRDAFHYGRIKDLASCRYHRVTAREGDYVEQSADLFQTLGFGWVVLSHPDAQQVYADHAEIRRIESRVRIEPVPS